jgi:hypothetical protein
MVSWSPWIIHWISPSWSGTNRLRSVEWSSKYSHIAGWNMSEIGGSNMGMSQYLCFSMNLGEWTRHHLPAVLMQTTTKFDPQPLDARQLQLYNSQDSHWGCLFENMVLGLLAHFVRQESVKQHFSILWMCLKIVYISPNDNFDGQNMGMWWFSSEFRATLFSDKPVCMCVLSTSSSWTQAGENQRLPSWVQLSQVYRSHLQWSPQKTSGGWAPPKKNRKVVEKWETWKYVENLVYHHLETHFSAFFFG